MIDPDLFDRHMRAVQARVGKPLGSEGTAMYYAILSEELTDEEFSAGMKAIFRDHAFATWPAPAAIIERAKPAGALSGVLAWTSLEDALKRRVPNQPLLPQLRACGVDHLAMSAFVAIGGISRWTHTNDFRFEEMRKEFLAIYEDLTQLRPGARQHLVEKLTTATVLGPARRSPALPAGTVAQTVLDRVSASYEPAREDDRDG